MADDFLSQTFEALAAPGVPAGPVASFPGMPDAPRLRHRDVVGQQSSSVDAVGEAVVPHPYTFTSIYNTVQRLYPQRAWDEAIRRSNDDAMAMRRDPFIHELLRQRQIPTAQLPFHIESDDPDDEEQGRICERIKQLIERIPNWTFLRIALLEGIFYGKAGAQIVCGPVQIHGHTRRSVVKWWPVNGDKIVFDWDMTPGLLVSGVWKAPEGAHVVFSDRGRVLKLDQPRFRRGIVIHQFEPTDMDYLLETAKSTAVAGLGLRDRLYWFWWLRQEVYSYWFDGLQRISTDGSLVGYFEAGNDRSKAEVTASLKMLHRDKVAVFPRYVVNGQQVPAFESLQPNQIAYAELREAVNALEDAMRRMVIGQSLTSQAEPTGLGSKVAELHDDTFTRIVRYDAKAIDETITRDLLPVLLEENEWVYRGKRVRALPFGVRYVSEIDRPDTEQKMGAATQFAGLGGRLDLEQLGTDLGLPLDPAGQPTAQDQQAQQMMQMLGAGGGGGSAGPDRNARTPSSPGQGFFGFDARKEHHASEARQGSLFDKREPEPEQGERCGAGTAGAPGFQAGNTCGGRRSSGKADQTEASERPEKAKDAPKQKRAGPGGEWGPNGEWYPAGAWIATTEKPKTFYEPGSRKKGKGGGEELYARSQAARGEGMGGSGRRQPPTAEERAEEERRRAEERERRERDRALWNRFRKSKAAELFTFVPYSLEDAFGPNAEKRLIGWGYKANWQPMGINIDSWRRFVEKNLTPEQVDSAIERLSEAVFEREKAEGWAKKKQADDSVIREYVEGLRESWKASQLTSNRHRKTYPNSDVGYGLATELHGDIEGLMTLVDIFDGDDRSETPDRNARTSESLEREMPRELAAKLARRRLQERRALA